MYTVRPSGAASLAGLILCLGSAAVMASQMSVAQTLPEIFRLAERSDPQFAAAQSEHEAVKEDRVQARAHLARPVSNLRAGAGRLERQTADPLGPDIDEVVRTRQYAASLTQPLIHYDRYIESEIVDTRLSRSAETIAAARQELMVRVAERYVDILFAADNLEFAHAEKTALQLQRRQAQQRFDAGFLALTDLQEIIAGFDLAVSQEIEAENRLANAVEALRTLTGERHAHLAGIVSAQVLPDPAPADIDWWVRTALEKSPRLRAARLGEDEARDEIRRQSAAALPTLDLVASIEYADERGDNSAQTESKNKSIGLELNVPLYTGGLIASRTRQAEHRYRQTGQRHEQQRRELIQFVRESYVNVVSAISRHRAARQAVASSATALKMTRLGFDAGTRTAVDVVNAERGFYRAKRDEARALYDYVLSRVRLEQGTGILTFESLAELSAMAL